MAKWHLTRRRAPFAAAFACALACAAAQAAPPALFPEEQIRPGLRGRVETVLRGAERESLDVEFLGVLPDGIAPGIDLILGRFVDEKGSYTGAAAGMSGSPVTVNGQLVGALSYSVGQFTKEQIFGITPIKSMLALRELPSGAVPWTLAPTAASGFRPIPFALAAPGLPPATLDQLGDLLDQIGLSRAAAFPASSAPDAPRSPAAGDMISALLIWGDAKLGASGTVTWRDGDSLLAFGHPFLGAGRIEAALAATDVLWTVPSALGSFKIARIGDPIGALRQDRATAIAGELGAPPAGLPVSVTVRRAGRPDVRKQFFVARDPFLAPVLVATASRIAVFDLLGADRDESLRLAGAAVLEGGRAVPLSAASGVAGPLAAKDQPLSLELLRKVGALMRPPTPLPALQRVDVVVEARSGDDAWRVARALPDRLAARPGETVRVAVDLESSRRGTRRETLELVVPRDAAPGRTIIVVGAAPAVAGELGSLGEARRRTADEGETYLAALGEAPPDDRLDGALLRPAEGIVAEGREFPALPNSAHLLIRSRPGGAELYRARWLVLARAERALDRAALDAAHAPLDILPAEPAR